MFEGDEIITIDTNVVSCVLGVVSFRSAKPVPELMGFQTVLSAELASGQATVVEGSDTFSAKVHDARDESCALAYKNPPVAC
ncbi:hypothetical protein [Alicyclobacillus mali (ex Roth et al. 2021)]|uniref:hypothetical protein n=1 Tax=Alicyclobacillus mali (ex Roth et al. 2021) TaxID=1123961 RepID=UPI000AD1E981|nr:hypothetical protein [Alicyclobacillus mali (ex Roth et al. 2021)]